MIAGDREASLTRQFDFLGGGGGHVGQRVAVELFRGRNATHVSDGASAAEGFQEAVGGFVQGAELEQDPLYRLQAFASYDFTPATYGALRLIHADGGELLINDQRIDDTHKRYTQVGFEVGHWLDQQNQLMFSLSQNVATDNGYHGTDALLRLVHVF